MLRDDVLQLRERLSILRVGPDGQDAAAVSGNG
jgi:hypothetical protein